MLLFNQAYQKRKFTFFKFQEKSTKKKKNIERQNNLHRNSYY